MKCIKYSALGFTCIGMGKDSEDASAPDWLEHSHQPASQPASHPVFPISRCPRSKVLVIDIRFEISKNSHGINSSLLLTAIERSSVSRLPFLFSSPLSSLSLLSRLFPLVTDLSIVYSLDFLSLVCRSSPVPLFCRD